MLEYLYGREDWAPRVIATTDPRCLSPRRGSIKELAAPDHPSNKKKSSGVYFFSIWAAFRRGLDFGLDKF